MSSFRVDTGEGKGNSHPVLKFYGGDSPSLGIAREKCRVAAAEYLILRLQSRFRSGTATLDAHLTMHIEGVIVDSAFHSPAR